MRTRIGGIVVVSASLAVIGLLAACSGPTVTAPATALPQPTSSAPPTSPGVITTFQSKSRFNAVVSNGAVIAVMAQHDDRPTSITTYDQRSGAVLAEDRAAKDELECGLNLAAGPDGTHVLLTVIDTSVPAAGIESGRHQVDLRARDARTLAPLWSIPLLIDNGTTASVSGDPDCGGATGTTTLPVTTDGRHLLSRSFGQQRLIDLGTGSMRPVPGAVNLLGDLVVVSTDSSAGDRPPFPGSVSSVRLVRADDLGTVTEVADPDVARAMSAATDGNDRGELAYHVQDSREGYRKWALSADARSLAVRGRGGVRVVDVASGQVVTTIPTPPSSSTADPTDSPLTFVPGTDVLVIAAPDRSLPGSNIDIYAGFDATGKKLWSLPSGAVDSICGVSDGVLLLRAPGTNPTEPIANVDPRTGRQISYDRPPGCPRISTGIASYTEGGTDTGPDVETTIRSLPLDG